MIIVYTSWKPKLIALMKIQFILPLSSYTWKFEHLKFWDNLTPTKRPRFPDLCRFYTFFKWLIHWFIDRLGMLIQIVTCSKSLSFKKAFKEFEVNSHFIFFIFSLPDIYE